MRFVLPFVALMSACVPAFAQAPDAAPPATSPAPATPDSAPSPATPSPATPAPATPAPGATAKPEKPEPETLRIRGAVERVEGATLSVQLSQGLSVRVETQPETYVMEATRIERGALKSGGDLRIRTRAGAQGAVIATEVMTIEASAEDKAPAANDTLSDISIQGGFKGLEEKTGDQILVVTEKGADRRVTLSKETSYWRLRPARVADIKPGMTLSVVIIREPGQSARAQRLVFGTSVTGAALPL